MRRISHQCLPVSLVRPHLFLVVIKYPVPEVTVPSCKVVLEFVPASYAINSLLNVCGHFASLQLVSVSSHWVGVSSFLVTGSLRRGGRLNLPTLGHPD